MDIYRALDVSGAKVDIIQLTGQIERHITAIGKTVNMERVHFDMRRSALARAVVAVETSLYDRKVLEDDLLRWAQRHAPPPPPPRTATRFSRRGEEG